MLPCVFVCFQISNRLIIVWRKNRRKILEAIFCLGNHNRVLPIFKQSLHLSTVRPSTPSTPTLNRLLLLDDSAHQPHLTDITQPITAVATNTTAPPINPSSSTTSQGTQVPEPRRLNSLLFDNTTAVEDNATSLHPSKILAKIPDIEKCLDIVATLQAEKGTGEVLFLRFSALCKFFPPTPVAFKMKPKTTAVPRAQRSKSFQGDGPNWVLIAGGALLSILSIRLGYKLKQALDTKPQENARNGSGKSSDQRKSAGCRVHSNVYSFTQQNDGGCFNCMSGTEGMMEMKCLPNDQMLTESDGALPLVMVPTPGFNKENGIVWASSPDRLELPPKPFLHHSNSSDSPCVSESGSDIFSKREVIQKLRQQLKRRDDMILEMQDQIVELQSSLNAQLAHSTNLQSQLDSANRDFFDSEREIQRLRKAIADHCVGHVSPIDRSPKVTIWQHEERNGHVNGFRDGESNFDATERGRGDGERVEMLKREVGELKEVIEGKEYLLQSYKEQKAEFSLKINELQQRLDSQLPNIL